VAAILEQLARLRVARVSVSAQRHHRRALHRHPRRLRERVDREQLDVPGLVLDRVRPGLQVAQLERPVLRHADRRLMHTLTGRAIAVHPRV
jgi:hypothetical protein